LSESQQNDESASDHKTILNLFYFDCEEFPKGYTLAVAINIPAITIYPIPKINLEGISFLANI
jgi:hypothetical protein